MKPMLTDTGAAAPGRPFLRVSLVDLFQLLLHAAVGTTKALIIMIIRIPWCFGESRSMRFSIPPQLGAVFTSIKTRRLIIYSPGSFRRHRLLSLICSFTYMLFGDFGVFRRSYLTYSTYCHAVCGVSNGNLE